MVVVVGADVHKLTHTIVAVDQAGRGLGHKALDATTPGHRQAVAWARMQFGSELVWAIDDCRHSSTRLKSEAAFPPWSGNTQGRVRLTRAGNRQLNAAIHRIAATQIRMDGLGKTY
jgi:transposase